MATPRSLDRLPGLLVLGALACAQPPARPTRPAVQITTEAAFDAAGVPAYPSDHAAVYAHIDASLGSHVANVERWLRQPSVSAQNLGIQQMAELVRADYKKLGSPVWRLIQALATLTTPDGNTITVPGYYAAIRQPNEEEQRLLNGLLKEWSAREPLQRQGLGVEGWIEGWEGRPTQLQLLFNTTLNVDGIVAGYAGEGTKTILPHRALAKVDSRLVPNQHPDSQLALIRRHLDSLGFSDITIRKLSGCPPAQSSIEAGLVQAAIGVFNKFGAVPRVAPRIAGSAPYYQFTDRLKLPMVAAGMGHGSGAHAPNEFMLVEPKAGSKVAGLARQERFYVDLLYALAAAK